MKRLLFSSALLAFSGVSSVQAKVVAPNVSIQNGSVSIVWRAPATQKYKISVFINNTATATNAVYRVYPKGKSAQTTTCSSTDVNYPCFKFAINQALNKGKWVQLRINNAATEWAFIQNKGVVTLASNNVSASETLGIAGVNFISKFPIKQTHDKWMRTISVATTAKNAISRCLNDNAGIKNSCNVISWGLSRYGIRALPAGISTGDTQADWEWMRIGNSGDLNAAIIIRGGAALGKCRVALIPRPNRNTGTIKWLLSAKATDSTLANDALCASFINGEKGEYVVYDYDTFDPVVKMREKWQQAFKASATLRQAINRCLNDNLGNHAMCDEWTTTELGKYGISSFPASNDNFEATRIDSSTDAFPFLSIAIQGQAPLAYCKMSLSPIVDRSVGVITWVIYSESTHKVIVSDAFCDSMFSGSHRFGGVYSFNPQTKIAEKWQNAFRATATLRQAISHCLTDNFGNHQMCNEITELGKYGISAFSPATADYKTVRIDTEGNTSFITIEGNAPLGYCKMSLVPGADFSAGYIGWSIYAEPIYYGVDGRCASYVQGAIAGAPGDYSDVGVGDKWISRFNPDQSVRTGWATTLATLKSVKQAINRCLIDNNGDKSLCNSVTTDADKLQKYGISALPAGTGFSDGNLPDATAKWQSMTLGQSGTLDAAIIIQGGYTLAECKITLQPTFDAGAKYVKWTYFAEAANFTLADTYKCSTFVNNAIAGAPY
jgi:hypothetical protein